MTQRFGIGIGQGHRHQKRAKQTAKQATKQAATQNAKLEAAMLTARLDDELLAEDEVAIEPEPLEPPELQDLGDSAAIVDEDEVSSAFDRAWQGDLRLITQLPRRLRPPVRYRIDGALGVHGLHAGGARELELELELAVAEAVAEHLRRTGAVLEQLGDWCRIPWIGRDAELVSLVPEPYAQQLGTDRMHSIGSVLKDFAIELPSGDVITPQILLSPPAVSTSAGRAGRKGAPGKLARRGKRTTRAAALRWESHRPRTTPDGESWSAKDWKEFSTNQRKGSVRVAKTKAGSKAKANAKRKATPKAKAKPRSNRR